jgi:hypothetical protein
VATQRGDSQQRIGYWPREVNSLPDPLKLYVDCGAKKQFEADK